MNVIKKGIHISGETAAFWGKAKLGDNITEDGYWDALGCMPPITNTEKLLQVGEPYRHDRHGRALYTTFQRDEKTSTWIFVGHLLEGESRELRS